jgi:predicted XRE-type DNA-binding protein
MAKGRAGDGAALASGEDAMTIEVFESVWDALEDTPTEAENMRLRSSLMIAISETVSGWRVTQTEAARRLGVTQPRLNDLLRGRVGKFSLDSLVALAARAGLAVHLEITLAA